MEKITREVYELVLTRRDYVLIFLILAMLSFLTIRDLLRFSSAQTGEIDHGSVQKQNYSYPIQPLVGSGGSTDLVSNVCKKYSLNETIIRNLIRRESNWDRFALSNRGARGLMQIMKPTWSEVCRKMGETWSFEEAFDSSKNLEVGCFYLRYLINWSTRRGDKQPIRIAIIAYNCGMGNVSRNKIPKQSVEFANQILFESSPKSFRPIGHP